MPKHNTNDKVKWDNQIWQVINYYHIANTIHYTIESIDGKRKYNVSEKLLEVVNE